MCTIINKQPKTIRTKQTNWAKMCSNFVICILLWVNGKGGAGRVQGKWPLVEGGHRVQLPDQISGHCPPLLPNKLKTSTMFRWTSSFYQNYHTSHRWPIHKVLRDPLNDLSARPTLLKLWETGKYILMSDSGFYCYLLIQGCFPGVMSL